MLSDYGFVRTAIDVVDTSPAGNLWAPVYSEPTFTYDYILVSTGTAPA